MPFSNKNREFNELGRAIDNDSTSVLADESETWDALFAFYEYDDHDGEAYQNGVEAGVGFALAAAESGMPVILSTGGEGWHLYVAGKSEHDCVAKMQAMVDSLEGN